MCLTTASCHFEPNAANEPIEPAQIAQRLTLHCCHKCWTATAEVDALVSSSAKHCQQLSTKAVAKKR